MEKQIDKEHFTNNQKFIDKLNEAIIELDNDPYALITFGHASMEVFEQMAKNNNMDLEDLVLKVIASYKEIIKLGEK